MSLIMVLIISISLSMDAFSLSLAYGTLNINKKNRIILSVIVGIFHFLMPLIGMYVGKKIVNLLPIEPNTLIFIILFFIGIEMILETFKEDKKIIILNLFEFIIFGFAVSLDSFSVGLGLRNIYSDPYIAASLFSISSFIFTFLGLKIGSKINQKIGCISTIFGGIVLIIIGITCLL